MAITLVISVVYAIGTYFVSTGFVEDDMNYICLPLHTALYLTFIQHCVNGLVTVICLIGLETKLCFANLMCAFVLYEAGMLIYLQIAYFNSMMLNCLQLAPGLYLWSML